MSCWHLAFKLISHCPSQIVLLVVISTEISWTKHTSKWIIFSQSILSSLIIFGIIRPSWRNDHLCHNCMGHRLFASHHSSLNSAPNVDSPHFVVSSDRADCIHLFRDRRTWSLLDLHSGLFVHHLLIRRLCDGVLHWRQSSAIKSACLTPMQISTIHPHLVISLLNVMTSIIVCAWCQCKAVMTTQASCLSSE